MKILYRAMCQEEFKAISDKRLAWNSRFKWFSSNKDFITNRVKDGKFNNSRFVPDRYSVLVEICIDNLDHFKQINNQELMLDRRHANQIKISYIKRVY
jgi:hypothetical protein